LEPPQRPIVQEQQDKGHGNQHGFAHETQGKEGQRQDVGEPPTTVGGGSDLGSSLASGCRLRGPAGGAGVTRISPECEEEKESAEDIFTFRHPGHGLDVQRMQRKESSDHQAAPKGAGHALQELEE